MARNDLVLLDGILDEYLSKGLPSNKTDEVFEYLATEQILKDYAFTKEQLLSGSVDGRNDGGIDEFFILVNGHLAERIPEDYWPKSNAELEVYIITCKHDDSFKQAPITTMIPSLMELLDFTISYVAKKHNIRSIQAIQAKNRELWTGEMLLSSYALTDEIVESVFAALPEQPWPAKVHKQVAEDLKLREMVVSNAIAYLIYVGRLRDQVYGYVFDGEGNIVAEREHFGHTEKEAREKLEEQKAAREKKFGVESF